MNTFDKRLASGLVAGLLIAFAAAGGIYAVAASAATSLADNFTPPPESAHLRVASISTAVNRASAEHKVARAKCKFGSAARRGQCYADAEATKRDAFEAARDQ